MRRPRAPEAPDPLETGRAQSGVNIATAIANLYGGQVNERTPYGSLDYTTTGWEEVSDGMGGTYRIPIRTATQTLSADGQRIQDNTIRAQTDMSGAAAAGARDMRTLMGQGLDMSGVPARAQVPGLQTNVPGAGPVRQTYGTDFSTDRRRVENALMSRMQPQMAQDRASREADLRQQGITLGSAAYDRAMGQLGQQANDARMQAILAGGQEQSRLVGMEAQRAGFENAAQAQAYGQNMQSAGFRNQALAQQYGLQEGARAGAIQEQVGLRNQRLNEIQALMGGSQVQNPNFVRPQGINIPTTDYAGLVQQGYANNMARYQQDMSAWNGLWGGLMGMGAAGLGGFMQGRA